MKFNKSLRPLFILNYLMQYSSIHHLVTTNDISNYLLDYFEPMDRKTIRIHLSHLQQAGYPIHYIHKSIHQGYYLDETCLTCTQLKIISDSLLSNPSIPNTTIDQILTKLSSLTKVKEYQIVKQQQYIPTNRTKYMELESTLKQCIESIALNQSIQFKYFDTTVKGNKRYRKNSKDYQLLPYYCFMQNGRYYLIGYDFNHHSLVHYRLDKMDHLLPLNIEESRPMYDQVKKRIETSIFLFTGDYENVSFEIKPNFLSVFNDQFNDIMLLKQAEDHLSINVTVQVNASFFAWLTHFNPHDVLITYPLYVKNQYKEYLKNIWSAY